MSDRLPGLETTLEAVDVGEGGPLVRLHVEQQGDVDVDALLGELFDRRQAFWRAGDLDHRVGAREFAEEAQRLLDRALGVSGQIRRYFKAGEAVGAARIVVIRSQDVGCHADVLDGQVQENRLRIALAALEERAEGVIVVGRA